MITDRACELLRTSVAGQLQFDAAARRRGEALQVQLVHVLRVLVEPGRPLGALADRVLGCLAARNQRWTIWMKSTLHHRQFCRRDKQLPFHGACDRSTALE